MVHTCNSTTWEAEAGGLQFEARLDYIARPCLKIKKRRGGRRVVKKE
jgi:hypothetical protein